jgi:hypothetical protein
VEGPVAGRQGELVVRGGVPGARAEVEQLIVGGLLKEPRRAGDILIGNGASSLIR